MGSQVNAVRLLLIAKLLRPNIAADQSCFSLLPKVAVDCLRLIIGNSAGSPHLFAACRQEQEMGSNKEHHLIGKVHERAVNTVRRIMHAMRNGHMYRSTDGINWELEDDNTIAPVPEGNTRITEMLRNKPNKNK